MKPEKKKYVFRLPSSLRHYEAAVFALRCFDNRFWKVFKRFMRHLGFGDIDPESVAGGAKILSSPEKEGDRDFILRELEKSTKLHHTKKVMLFTHHDCGAYGGLARFGGDEEKEFAFHVREHRKARDVIKKHFSALAVETYFIDTEGVAETTHLL